MNDVINEAIRINDECHTDIDDGFHIAEEGEHWQLITDVEDSVIECEILKTDSDYTLILNIETGKITEHKTHDIVFIEPICLSF